MQLTKDRTEEIRKELAELHNTLKMSVQKAIRIGQLLTEQRDFLGHGNFLPWLDSNFEMGQRNAYRYMDLFEHQSKVANLANLQEAYKQIETIEAQERQTEEERKRGMIAEFRKTGMKPQGWDRSLDYTIKKDADNIQKQKERVDNAFKDRQATKEQRANTTDFMSEALGKATADILSKHHEMDKWKEKIRLSDGGKDNAFMDAIIEYLETLPDDSRRIEACNNIIKICRNISIELQKAKN